MRSFHSFAWLPLVFCTLCAWSQSALVLSDANTPQGAMLDHYKFVSDGPAGAGWSRPDEIARAYFHEELSPLFERTLTLDQPLEQHTALRWIFTGPHAGFIVELSESKVRIAEHSYDSYGLYDGQGNHPDKKILEQERQFLGPVHSLTVVADAHLAVRVLLNGQAVLEVPLLFDVTRHQLQFSALRNQHSVASGTLIEPQAIAASIEIKEGQKHQKMLGFGGSPSIPAYNELSEQGRNAYWNLIKHYNLLLQREYPMGTELKPDLSNMDNAAEATPHYYGDNFPNSEVSSFDYNRKITALGGDVIYELWALPKWATEAYDGPHVYDAWNKSIKTQAKADEYARIAVEFCKKEKEKTSAAPLIIGVQNEVEEPPAVFAAMVLALRHALDNAGFTSTRIHMADAPYMYMGSSRAKDLAQNAAAWKALDYTATHEYDFQEFAANPDMYDARLKAMREASKDKEFIATEICLNDAHLQEASYRVAFAAAQLYHKNLTELDAVALMYCWVLLDVEEPSFGASRSLLVPDRTQGWTVAPSSFQLRVLGAYSRHIHKGMLRVSANSNDPDLLTTAFADSKDETVVMINRGSVARSIQLTGATHAWAEIERTSTEEENAVSTPASSLVLAPGEIVVLSTIHAN
ncbi:hypothetical protein ACOBR2_04015 [Telmatobacter bradus]|uniref:hypothetical protein n=1 Tax=Telmatobacter bradus TaxID=474953 RepID=UPI003B42C971